MYEFIHKSTNIHTHTHLYTPCTHISQAIRMMVVVVMAAAAQVAAAAMSPEQVRTHSNLQLAYPRSNSCILSHNH